MTDSNNNNIVVFQLYTVEIIAIGQRFKTFKKNKRNASILFCHLLARLLAERLENIFSNGFSGIVTDVNQAL